MLEDFEDNVSIFDTGDTSFFQILTNGGFSSNNYLQSLNSASQHRSVTASTFTWDNTTSETLRAYLRLDLGGTNLAALRFGAVNNTFNGYGVYIDSRNGTDGTAGFQLRINNTTVPLAFQEVLITPSVWYRVEVEWQNTSPRITARLYEGNNTTLLAELTSNDTSYMSGSVGVHAFDLASFDTVGFIPQLPPLNAVVSSQTGATVTTVNVAGTNYDIYTFAENGSITFSGVGTIEYLAVGGGGGGGGSAGSQPGGGGGGGQVKSGILEVIGSTYTITVGQGGNAVTTNASGGNGTDSDILLSSISQISGAAAGGLGGRVGAGGSENGSGGASGAGFPGGGGDGWQVGGGGGGSAGAGESATLNNSAGDGGQGIQSDISGTLLGYGGGGGGGTYFLTNNPGVGVDGGGNGGIGDHNGNGIGATNAGAGQRGGGGGGVHGGANGSFPGTAISGVGGDGIVIIKVLTPLSSSPFDIVLRNPGGGFNIVLGDILQPELVYVGSNWTSRYLGTRSDAQIYVGNQQLR